MSWVVWLIIAVVCLVIETATVDFTFMMLASAALITTGVSVATENLIIQILVFAVAATLLVFFVRPWAKDKMNPRGAEAGNVYGIIGKTARALTQITSESGRVKIGGDVWSARAQAAHISEGSEVTIVKIEGVVAVVSPSETRGESEK